MGTKSKMVGTTNAVQGNASPFIAKQWYFHSKASKSVCDNADINILDAWKFSKGHPAVTIAVIDSEIESSTEKAYNEHGWLCAQVAAGKFGVAPKCTTMLVKIPLQASDESLIQIFEKTSAKADVICCSWAATPVYKPLSPKLYKCIRRIASTGGPRQNGCMICFAAGNYNAPVKHLNNKEFVWLDESIDFIRVTKGPIENGFASHPDVITVSACTSLNKKAKYSNWGKEVNLCAPSNNFHPFTRRFIVEGRMDVPVFTETNILKTDSTATFGGTSFSTALVSGVAALIRSANPCLSASRIREILLETADEIQDTDVNSFYGTSCRRYFREKSNWPGSGKVNAGRALSMAVKSNSMEQGKKGNHLSR